MIQAHDSAIIKIKFGFLMEMLDKGKHGDNFVSVSFIPLVEQANKTFCSTPPIKVSLFCFAFHF